MYTRRGKVKEKVNEGGGGGRAKKKRRDKSGEDLCSPCFVHITRLHDDDEKPSSGATRRNYGTEHRLSSKENGMVMLPRRFYNSHPARHIRDEDDKVRTRSQGPKARMATRAGEAAGKARRADKRSPADKSKSERGYKSARSAVVKTKNVKTKKLRAEKSPRASREYRLMFVEPEEETAPTVEAPSKTARPIGGSLARLVADRQLPSERWKIEKIYFEGGDRKSDARTQPYDALDAELEALMGAEPGTEAEPKRGEEFPSIMEILNEPTGDPEEAAVERVRRERKTDAVSDADLKNVIFEKLAEDGTTIDRAVSFQYNLEYAVTMAGRKVELVGAPELITSGEDLAILLQIVDDLDPDGGCVKFCDS